MSVCFATGMLSLGACVASPPAQEAPALVQEAPAALITAASLERHVRALAADDLRGRNTGSEEAMVAARYLAGELEAYGLQPGGDKGTFLQAVPLNVLSFESVPQLVVKTTAGEELEGVYGVDFEGLSGLPVDTELSVRLVSSEHDVPADIDGGTALFIDGNSRDRREWLADSEGWGLVIRRGSAKNGRERTRPPSGRRWMGEGAPPAPSFSVRGDLRKRFLDGEVVSLRVVAEGAVERLPASNVVGVLRGTGELAQEAVIFTAHYDHIGAGEPPEDDPEADVIYNGADDDASGCAAVLALAQALAAEGPAERTLIFMLVTGEEIGLVGTKYYIEHPLVPLDATVCNLNFEMIGRPDELVEAPGQLWLTGDERTNLLEAFKATGALVSADVRPEQRFFERSDNYAFARLGIVAQSLSSYNLHQDYHKVTDEADTLDYAHMETAVRNALQCARGLADGSIRPQWKPGGDPSADD